MMGVKARWERGMQPPAPAQSHGPPEPRGEEPPSGPLRWPPPKKGADGQSRVRRESREERGAMPGTSLP